MTATAARALVLGSVATPRDTRPHLTARSVWADRDVLAMGAIRDRQRAGFSHDHSPITPEMQIRWWDRNKFRLIAYLYDDVDGNTVGYGALRQEDDGRWYSSVAVLPEFGGHGYGRTITTHLVLSVPFDVWASARNDNPAAQKLHDPCIWDVLGADNDLIYYRTRPKVRLVEPPVSLAGAGDGYWYER